MHEDALRMTGALAKLVAHVPWPPCEMPEVQEGATNSVAPSARNACRGKLVKAPVAQAADAHCHPYDGDYAGWDRQHTGKRKDVRRCTDFHRRADFHLFFSPAQYDSCYADLFLWRGGRERCSSYLGVWRCAEACFPEHRSIRLKNIAATAKSGSMKEEQPPFAGSEKKSSLSKGDGLDGRYRVARSGATKLPRKLSIGNLVKRPRLRVAGSTICSSSVD